MIAMASEFLLFQNASGEATPFSAETISSELLGKTAQSFDAEFLVHAAKAVFYHFKHDLGLQSVSVGQFAQAMEKVLAGFARTAREAAAPTALPAHVLELDLCRLAGESGEGCELFFFPRLRAELRQHLSRRPRLLRLNGLRGCVKCLAGTQRWSPRCRHLEERIVEFLRQCLSGEDRPAELALVVGP